jgi:Mn-dependent DtxR family transcriptional regulator
MLATHLQVRNRILEQAVESLEQQGLVEVIKHRTIDGPQLDLTRVGATWSSNWAW